MPDDPLGFIDGECRAAGGAGGTSRGAEKGKRTVDELDFVQSGYDLVLAIRSIGAGRL